MIRHNQRRKAKELFTHNDEGDPVVAERNWVVGPWLTWHLNVRHALQRGDIRNLNGVGLVSDIRDPIRLGDRNNIRVERPADGANKCQRFGVQDLPTVEEQ